MVFRTSVVGVFIPATGVFQYGSQAKNRLIGIFFQIEHNICVLQGMFVGKVCKYTRKRKNQSM